MEDADGPGNQPRPGGRHGLDVRRHADGHARSWSPPTATRLGRSRLRRRVVPIGSYIVATAPLGDELAREADPSRPGVERHPDICSTTSGSRPDRPDGVRRPSLVHADRDGPKRAAPRHRDAEGVSPSSRRCRWTSPGPGNVGFTLDRMPHAGRMDGDALRAGVLRPRGRAIPPGSAPGWVTDWPAGASCPADGELPRHSAVSVAAPGFCRSSADTTGFRDWMS